MDGGVGEREMGAISAVWVDSFRGEVGGWEVEVWEEVSWAEWHTSGVGLSGDDQRERPRSETSEPWKMGKRSGSEDGLTLLRRVY